MRKQKQGFTLIELLIVIAIIGILAAIGISAFAGAQGRARDSKRKTDTHQLANYLLSEYLQNQSVFPLSDPAVGAPPTWGPVWFGEDSTQSSLTAASETVGFALARSPNQGPAGGVNDYWYVSDAIGETFAIWTKLEAGSGNWFVVNSKGFSNEVDGSSTISTVPARSPQNTECVATPSGTLSFSPCAARPVIQ